REPDNEIVFQSFIQQRPLFNFFRTGYVIVATTNQTHDILTFDFVFQEVESCNCEGTGRFGYNGFFIIELKNGCANLTLRNQQDAVEIFTAYFKRSVANTFNGSSIHEFINMIEGNNMAF